MEKEYLTRETYNKLNYGYYIVSWEILKEYDLKPSEIEVFMLMNYLADKQVKIFAPKFARLFGVDLFKAKMILKDEKLVMLTLADLAGYMNCSKKTISRAWGNLENLGLIVRDNEKYKNIAAFKLKKLKKSGIRIPVIWYQEEVSFGSKLIAGLILSYLGLDRKDKDLDGILKIKLRSHQELGSRLGLNRKTVLAALKDEVPKILNVEVETINERKANGRFLSNNYFKIYFGDNGSIFPNCFRKIKFITGTVNKGVYK